MTKQAHFTQLTRLLLETRHPPLAQADLVAAFDCALALPERYIPDSECLRFFVAAFVQCVLDDEEVEAALLYPRMAGWVARWREEWLSAGKRQQVVHRHWA
jgi:hypothetical protein